MRNYFFSTLVHVILFLLLLLAWALPEQEPKELDYAILVDFSNVDVPTQKASRPAKPVAPKQKQKASTSKPEKTVERAIEKPEIKTFENNKPLLTSQKPKAVRKQIDKPAKEISPSIEELEKQKAELKAKQEAKEKEEQVSYFKSLFEKSEKLSKENKTKESDNSTKSEAHAHNIGSKYSNIKGEIGSRKVLRTPIINDTSQKQGRVVVKICVDASGKVTSSSYTQKGSTTADSYLIKLAEKGASEYLFSPSDSERECGKVIIDFSLRA